MENTKKKGLMINCATCDVRNIQESVLEGYEKIQINAANVIANARSSELLSRYNVASNTANILNVEEDCDLSFFNGSYELRPESGPAPDKLIYLMVNGRLTVAPGAEEALKRYVGISVNGTLLCPESLLGHLTNVQVNGGTRVYPDGFLLMKDTLVLDRTFVLRARQDAGYFAAKRVVALAEGIGFEKLAEKNVRFATKQVIITEGAVEAAMPLFDERAEIIIVPDGCAWVDDDAKLDESLLRRYGDKLFVNGDLTVGKDGGEALKRVKYLRVNGDVEIPRSLEGTLHAINAEYEDLVTVAGTVLEDWASVTVDRSMLERAEDGLTIRDCVNVKFEEDIPPDLLAERLVSVSDCANVLCTEGQRGVIQLVARDVAHIGFSAREENGEAQDEDEEDCVIINAAAYKF